jgi:hypothetical protein
MNRGDKEYQREPFILNRYDEKIGIMTFDDEKSTS